MKIRILKLKDDYEVENIILDTKKRIIAIVDIENKLFETLINCDKQKRILIINKLL
jgi:hypothetical protein